MNVQFLGATGLFMGKEPLVLGEEVGLGLESVLMLLRREKCPSLLGIRGAFKL